MQKPEKGETVGSGLQTYSTALNENSTKATTDGEGRHNR